MRPVILHLTTGLAAAIVAAEQQPSFDDLKALAEIIAEAPVVEALEKRGPTERELFYRSQEKHPYTGWIKKDHANGSTSWLSYVKRGEPHGGSITWYENGTKCSESQFANGKLHGPAIVWRKDGTKSSEQNHEDGKADGLWIFWHRNGKKQMEGPYNNGKKDGLWTTWNRRGERTYMTLYKEGKVVDSHSIRRRPHSLL